MALVAHTTISRLRPLSRRPGKAVARHLPHGAPDLTAGLPRLSATEGSRPPGPICAGRYWRFRRGWGPPGATAFRRRDDRVPKSFQKIRARATRHRPTPRARSPSAQRCPASRSRRSSAIYRHPHGRDRTSEARSSTRTRPGLPWPEDSKASAPSDRHLSHEDALELLA